MKASSLPVLASAKENGDFAARDLFDCVPADSVNPEGVDDVLLCLSQHGGPCETDSETEVGVRKAPPPGEKDVWLRRLAPELREGSPIRSVSWARGCPLVMTSRLYSSKACPAA